MITLEDYELSYNEYLANKEYQLRSSHLEIDSLHESQVYIEEGFKENLKKYTDKVIAGIQKAWNKFKDNVNKNKLKWKDEEIQKAIDSDNINVNIKNYVEYDPNVIVNTKVQTLDYNTMKDSLKDEETFMNKYYPSIYGKKGNSIGEKFAEACVTKREDTHQVTKDDLQKMYDYIKNNQDQLDQLGKDLDQVNQAAKNVDWIANMVSSATPAGGATPNNGGGNATANESYSYYFREADGDKDNQVVSTSDTAGNAGGNDNTANGGEKETKADTQAQKDVQVYFKCTSQLLSAMMKTSRDIYHLYDSVISTHMNNVQKEAKNKNTEEAPEVASTATGGTAQITK